MYLTSLMLKKKKTIAITQNTGTQEPELLATVAKCPRTGSPHGQVE